VSLGWSRIDGLRRSPLLRQAGIYTGSQLVNRAIPFILLPVLTRFLTPADYGIVTMLLLVAVLAEPFVGMSLAGAITVKYYDKTLDLPAFIGTGARVVGAVAVPATLLVALLRDPLSQITQVPAIWLLLVIPLAAARTVGAAQLALLRVRGRAFFYGVLQNLQSAMLLGLSLLFVVQLGLDWRGRVVAEVLAALTFAVVGLLWLRRAGWVRWTFVAAYARQLTSFGVPLIPHALAAVLMVQTDRLLLTNMVGVGETGLYTVGYQLALVIEVIALSFNNAYAPWLYQRLTDANAATRRTLVRYTYLAFGGLAILALGTAIVMPRLAALLLDARYANSGSYVPWFAVGFLFSGMYYLVTNYIFFAQRTGRLAVVTATTAIINIALTYALITVNGGLGAAQSMAISFAISFVLTWIVSQRAYPMPWLSAWRTQEDEPA
jgi:O-antigen/teichoic acid export membrane protein